MDRHSHNLVFSGLIGAVTALVAVGGFLVMSSSPGADQASEIPTTPAEGLADRDDASLGLSADGTTAEEAGRPVLQVVDPSGADPTSGPAADVQPGLEPNATESATTDPATPSAVDPSSTVATAPSTESTAPATTAVPTSGSMASSTTVPMTMGTVPPDHEWLGPVEWEIVRLTNELRTDPNGPLKREGAVIDCGGRVPLDAATGQYQPAGALTVDQVASVEVARPWSAQLTTDLLHRPQAGIKALQGAGVAVMTAGENIAYHNFPDTAYRHFVGWRESDGHFCNMMDPGFTHIGIGEHTGADGFSYATQNFFSLQPNG